MNSLTVFWFPRYNLSFRDLVEMMDERGLSMPLTTVMRSGQGGRCHLIAPNKAGAVIEGYDIVAKSTKEI